MINNITSLGTAVNAANLNRVNSTTGSVADDSATGNIQSPNQSFADTFNNAINSVNQSINEADAKMADLATGQSKDIHGTMIAMQKADISLRLMLNVRNKIVSAYQEISRMQI